MFGEVATRLLRMTGHSGTVPSAILPADIPAAIDRLEAALRGQSDPRPQQDDKRDDEPPVGLQQRALPLLELLRRAADGDVSVTWEDASG